MKRLLLIAAIFSSMLVFAENDRDVSSVSSEGSFSKPAAYLEKEAPKNESEKDEKSFGVKISKDYFEKYVHPELRERN